MSELATPLTIFVSLYAHSLGPLSLVPSSALLPVLPKPYSSEARPLSAEFPPVIHWDRGQFQGLTDAQLGAERKFHALILCFNRLNLCVNVEDLNRVTTLTRWWVGRGGQ